MTKLLEDAFSQAAALPDLEQDSLAALIMDEMQGEAEWDAAFAASQDELARMAREALDEYDAGKTKPLDLSRDF